MKLTESLLQTEFARGSVKLPPTPCPAAAIPASATSFGRAGMPTDYSNCIVFNMPWMESEADILAMNTFSGCVLEVEIKIEKGDLESECAIASYAGQSAESSISTKEKKKYLKHFRFHEGNLSHPPHYYSFLVPDQLEKQAVEEGPYYAGVLVATEPQSETDSWKIRWSKAPKPLSSRPVSDIFLRLVTTQLYESSRELFHKQQTINLDWTAHHSEMLNRVAKAVKVAETELAGIPHGDVTIREAIYGRAVSGMRQRDKEHVWRIYEKLYLQKQLDLF